MTVQRLTPAAARSRRWLVFCSLVLLTASVASLIHAASPHCSAPSDCTACRVLQTPALARTTGPIARPATPVPALSADAPSVGALEIETRLHPLRAPPSRPTA
ncbi:MAG: hypothetical protein HY049_05785 [Acidobacteria bacterium]|nr:hypothetical protein [Acidobacteriota bacterium]